MSRHRTPNAVQQEASSTKPSVFITKSDLDVLDGMIGARSSSAAARLREELDRAVVVDDAATARRFVQLGSSVDYLDLGSGRTRTVRIVHPKDADIDEGALSILTPVGAALFGLSAGDSISMTTEDGREHVLVVVSLNP